MKFRKRESLISRVFKTLASFDHIEKCMEVTEIEVKQFFGVATKNGRLDVRNRSVQKMLKIKRSIRTHNQFGAVKQWGHIYFAQDELQYVPNVEV